MNLSRSTMGASEVEDLARWQANLASGSETYAVISARRLRAFCKSVGVSPIGLVEMGPDRLRDTILDYLASEKKKGHSGGYIGTTTKAIRSWLRFNRKSYPEDINIPNTKLHPRIVKEDTPTTDDLRRVLASANSYERVAISLVAFGGLRLQTLGSYLGDDGLIVSDFPEMRVKDGRVSFLKIPTMVRVREGLSKADHGYFTFLGEEGCEYLRVHLEERMRHGEKIGPETDIVTPSHASKKFVRTTNVSDRIRQRMRAADVAARPYAWRSYFFQKALEAQSASGGKVPDRFVEFFGGHTGDVTQKHYGPGKPNMPTDLVEQMRTAYGILAQYVETVATERRKDFDSEMRVRLGKVVGMTPEEVSDAEDDTEFLRLFKERLLGSKPASVPQTQRIVSIEEAPAFLSDGWTVQTAVGSSLVLNPPA